jgi:hypothetical protein
MKLREPRFANVNVENIVDKSLMEKLEASGFIDQVYGGSAR